MGKGREGPAGCGKARGKAFGALGALLLGITVWGCSDSSPFMPLGVTAFTILPETVTLGPGETVQLRIQGLPASHAAVTWTATPEYVVSVDGKGLVVGRGAGRAWIKAAAGEFSDSAVVEVRHLDGRAFLPNEPVGFERIAEHDFSCRPGEGCALAGAWGESGAGFHASNLAIVERSDAPAGGTRVARTRFPRGLRAGVGPVSFWGWSDRAEEFRGVYISKWIRVEGRNYENHPGITKLGWIGYAQAEIDNQSFLSGQTTPSTGKVELVGDLQPSFRQQNHVDRAEWGSGRIRVGQWQQWEVLLELNDLGRGNGVFKWWIDGRLVLALADVVYVTPGDERGFFSYRWNPTWGGVGDFVKSRDDFMEIAHVYIAGMRK